MSPEEFLVKMIEIDKGGDPEIKHGEADNLMMEVLREFGYGEGINVFDEMDKWYA